MVVRWIAFILGAALLQSLSALSPIPVPEDEWTEFWRMLRDPSYRLPTTTRPSRYEINLTPYFDITTAPNIRPFSFDGIASIYIAATEANVREIVMHCNDLTIQSVSVTLNNAQIGLTSDTFECEMPRSFLRIGTNEALQLGQEYVVRVTYTGNLQTNMRGFYRSWYRDSTGIRWMGTTQFQPGHARQAFPCYDEPSFKALFDITINRESSFQSSISNMPIRNTAILTNGRTAETFYTTPLTSTYLVAFIVSHYQKVSTNNNLQRPFDIYARDNAGSTGDWSLEIGEKLLEAMENYTQISYYTMAENINMKQAAIPDFSAGAMENWGLLTYREALILYDPQNSNHFYKQRVANIVSHEVAHMWFGNLVTCAWWDNLWLNEGFARFYQYYLTHSVAPDLGYDIRFIVEQVHSAMLPDSIDSAHALTNPDVNDPATVSAHFSVITYARGASVLRMTQHLLGEDTFVKGLRRYLDARKFDVAEPGHLFEALDAAAAEDNALAQYNGITIDRYFKSWSEKAGHPVLTVSINQRTGQMIVTQSRWDRDNGVSQFPSLWDVPITWTRGGAPEFNNLKPSEVLTAQVSTIQRGTEGHEWVIFNKQESGFYRVNYDNTNWALLTRALRSNNRTLIHELNRAQIVDDLFAFGRAGVVPYNRVFNVLSFLKMEDGYAPWIAAITGFNFAASRLSYNSTHLQRLRNEIINLSTAVTARLGYTEVNTDTYMDGLLRMYVMTFLCNMGHPECTAAARQNFASWRSNTFLPANMRPWVYCSGLRQGTAEDFDYFWNRFLNEDLASEIVVMIQAAGCTSDQLSLDKFLDAIISNNDIIRPQDFSTAWNSAVTGNEENTSRLFNWLRRNVNQVIANLGSAATPISNIASRLRNEEQINEFLAWLEQNREILGNDYNTGISGITTTRNNLEWSVRRVSEFLNYFDTGFVEDELDDITDEDGGTEDGGTEDGGTEDGGTEDGGEDSGDGEPDSANIVTLSIVTLVTTVAISLMV
nr:membrane alanyl aminopeptidase-like [Vanessa tameamea]